MYDDPDIVEKGVYKLRMMVSNVVSHHQKKRLVPRDYVQKFKAIWDLMDSADPDDDDDDSDQDHDKKKALVQHKPPTTPTTQKKRKHLAIKIEKTETEKKTYRECAFVSAIGQKLGGQNR